MNKTTRTEQEVRLAKLHMLDKFDAVTDAMARLYGNMTTEFREDTNNDKLMREYYDLADALSELQHKVMVAMNDKISEAQK